MGYNNINCVNIHKVGCDYYIDRFYCPENCPGFASNGEIKNDVKIENSIPEKKKKF